MVANNSSSLADPLRDHVGNIVLQTIVFIMVETVGNFALLAHILHEKYGMDPQKRSMSNQIFSSICACFIIFNLLMLPIWFVYRVHYFDVVWIKVFVVYGVGALGGFTFFSLAEMVVIRLLYIFCFSKTTIINESFATLILTSYKISYVTLGIAIKLMTQEYKSNPYIAEVDNGIVDDFHKKINLYINWTPLLVSFPVISIGLPIIFYKKHKARAAPQSVIVMSNIAPQETIIEDNAPRAQNEEEVLPPGIIQVLPYKQDEDLTQDVQADGGETSDNEIIAMEPAIDTSVEPPIEPQTSQKKENHTCINFNNSRFNEHIVNYLGIVIMSIGLLAFFIPSYVVSHHGIGMYDAVSNYMFVVYSLLITLIPLSYFLKRPRKFLDVLEMFGIYCNCANSVE